MSVSIYSSSEIGKKAGIPEDLSLGQPCGISQQDMLLNETSYIVLLFFKISFSLISLALPTLKKSVLDQRPKFYGCSRRFKTYGYG